MRFNVIHEANGARFIVKDDMIVWWCRKEGKPFEPETTEWLLDTMRQRGGGYADVGASTGWFVIPMALRGYEVTAVEANPTVRKRLRENAALNDVEFRIVPAAASDKAGRATFWHNRRLPLTSGGSIQKATCSNPGRMEVDTVRLDDVLGDVSLVKIDVEGHELSVLKGAEKTIERCRPHLMLEANTDAHRAALAEWLAAHEYDWRRADDRNMLCSPAS